MKDKPVILIVDDQPQDIELLEAHLVPQGYEIVKAASGEEALEKLPSNQIELVLMDILMPGMDGFEATRRIRRDTAHRRIPIILVTALQETEDRVKGIEAGCDDFLSKPFDKMELFARVRSLLQVKAYNDLMRDYQIELEAMVTSRTEKLRHGLENLQQEITERKRVEEALRESSARIQAITDSAKDAIIMMGPEGEISYWNPMAESIFGYTANEVMGQNLHHLLAPERYHEAFRKTFPAFQKTGQGNAVDQTIELRALGKSSREFPVSLSLSSVLLRDKWHAVGIVRDITEQKRTEEERQKLQAQFTQAQKMESVGRLAGGVAHDFNNMLSVILGYTELALDRVDQSDPLHADLQEIYKAAKRSTEITRQLLAFARKQTISPKVLDVNETVEGMLKMLRRLIGEDIDLAWRPEEGLFPVKMDPAQIDQILANLCVNARDAIAGVGKITIETHMVTFDAAYCADHAGFVPGDFVLLAVSDDGCGMDKETLSKIFEPFFTTKDVNQGTGLGLATVFGIVKQNNGFINVYSEPGQGTTFRIYLARHVGAAEKLSVETVTEIPASRGETVVLVEDEPAIIRMCQVMLERLGYQVLATGTPSEALRLAENHAGEIDLLITDVIMPEMNGRDLADRLYVLFPDLKTLFMSGYTANVIAHRGVLDEGVNFIQKPFSIKDLSVKVRATLDQK
jgi:PAS domain S-box-containing protein